MNIIKQIGGYHIETSLFSLILFIITFLIYFYINNNTIEQKVIDNNTIEKEVVDNNNYLNKFSRLSLTYDKELPNYQISKTKISEDSTLQRSFTDKKEQNNFMVLNTNTNTSNKELLSFLLLNQDKKYILNKSKNTTNNEKNTTNNEKNTIDNEKNTIDNEKNTTDNEKNTNNLLMLLLLEQSKIDRKNEVLFEKSHPSNDVKVPNNSKNKFIKNNELLTFLLLNQDKKNASNKLKNITVELKNTIDNEKNKNNLLMLLLLEQSKIDNEKNKILSEEDYIDIQRIIGALEIHKDKETYTLQHFKMDIDNINKTIQKLNNPYKDNEFLKSIKVKFNNFSIEYIRKYIKSSLRNILYEIVKNLESEKQKLERTLQSSTLETTTSTNLPEGGEAVLNFFRSTKLQKILKSLQKLELESPKIETPLGKEGLLNEMIQLIKSFELLKNLTHTDLNVEETDINNKSESNLKELWEKLINNFKIITDHIIKLLDELDNMNIYDLIYNYFYICININEKFNLNSNINIYNKFDLKEFTKPSYIDFIIFIVIFNHQYIPSRQITKDNIIEKICLFIKNLHRKITDLPKKYEEIFKKIEELEDTIFSESDCKHMRFITKIDSNSQ